MSSGKPDVTTDDGLNFDLKTVVDRTKEARRLIDELTPASTKRNRRKRRRRKARRKK